MVSLEKKVEARALPHTKESLSFILKVQHSCWLCYKKDPKKKKTLPTNVGDIRGAG